MYPSDSVVPIKQDPQTTIASKVRGLDFCAQLAPGEILVGAPTVTAAYYAGLPDPIPEGIISGAPIVLGTQALQRISGGQAGTAYVLACVVRTSLGNVLEEFVYFWVSQG